MHFLVVRLKQCLNGKRRDRLHIIVPLLVMKGSPTDGIRHQRGHSQGVAPTDRCTQLNSVLHCGIGFWLMRCAMHASKSEHERCCCYMRLPHPYRELGQVQHRHNSLPAHGCTHPPAYTPLVSLIIHLLTALKCSCVKPYAWLDTVLRLRFWQVQRSVEQRAQVHI